MSPPMAAASPPSSRSARPSPLALVESKPEAARDFIVRADTGPQRISRHFTRQIARWDVALPHSFPHQPETNGVAERFFRTLKEQAMYGRIFHTVAEVRVAVATFLTRYNASWRLARLG
jgi:putative transposase